MSSYHVHDGRAQALLSPAYALKSSTVAKRPTWIVKEASYEVIQTS